MTKPENSVAEHLDKMRLISANSNFGSGIFINRLRHDRRVSARRCFGGSWGITAMISVSGLKSMDLQQEGVNGGKESAPRGQVLNALC